jgi:hypothetical protein
VRRLVPLFVLALAGVAEAQGVGVPSSRWGVGFGNSPEFTGLRFNFRDERVRRVDGINLTLWGPRGENPDSVITGLSFGPLPGGGTVRGLQLGLLGVMGFRDVIGVSIAPLGMGTGRDLLGIQIAGLGLGAGRDVVGLSVATLGLGAGGDLVGVTIAGLGAGAGGRMIGLNVAGLGLGSGRGLAGINLAGLALGSGGTITGLSIAGLAAGAPALRGVTIAVGVVGGEHLAGLHLAGASVHVAAGGSLAGVAISPFNYIRGAQTGVAIGVVNYAWSVRGLQLGLVNIVRDNPAPLKVLPVLNTSF